MGSQIEYTHTGRSRSFTNKKSYVKAKKINTERDSSHVVTGRTQCADINR